MEERQNTDRENTRKQNDQVMRLTKSLNTLNTTISNANARAQGVSSTVKWVWTLFGTLLIAVILSGASSHIKLREEVAVLKERGVK